MPGLGSSPVPAAPLLHHTDGEESRAAGGPAPVRDRPTLRVGRAGRRRPLASPTRRQPRTAGARSPGGCRYCPGGWGLAS